MNPEIAVIARAGAHRAFEVLGLERSAMHAPETPFGTSVPIHIFDSDSGPFAVVSRHGESGYEVSAPFVNDKANLWALKNIGVEKIVSWSAPGSLNPAIAPGDLVVPDDVIEWGGRVAEESTFFVGRGPGVVRSWPAFCPELRESFLDVISGFEFRVHGGGTYASTTGPRLETAAEISALAKHGASLVGMTLTPELWLARELEFCYAAICYSVNFAEGVKERPFKPGALFEGLATEEEEARVKEVEDSFADIIMALLPAASATGRDCACPRLLERYRRRGDFDRDWWRQL